MTELGNTLFSAPFLGSKDHGGFLYLRPTFQCLHNVPAPPQPFLVAVLIQKWEAPWAKVRLAPGRAEAEGSVVWGKVQNVGVRWPRGS